MRLIVGLSSSSPSVALRADHALLLSADSQRRVDRKDHPNNQSAEGLHRMHVYLAPVTPAEINPALQALIDLIVPGGQAQLVPVRPVDSAPINECFSIVKGRVAAHGGELVTGWSLWVSPRLFVEAEFHGVWRDPSGALVDLAPKAKSVVHVLFLPDPSKTFDEVQVPNIRRPIRPIPELLAYFETFDAEYELMNRGERIGVFGEMHLQGSEADEYHAIMSTRAMLHVAMFSLFAVATSYDPCPCGSGKKIRWCHREYAK